MVCQVLLSVLAAMAVGTTTARQSKVQQQFYVSPAGSDDDPGTEAKPFATIQRARSAVCTGQSADDRGPVVVLRGGTYRLAETLAFDAEDSGTGGFDVVYKGFPGEIAGGERRPGHHRLAAGRGRAMEGPHGHQQFPTALRERRSRDSRKRTRACGHQALRRRWVQDDAGGDGRLAKPGRHRAVLLCACGDRSRPGRTRGARSRPSTAKGTRRSSRCSSRTSPSPGPRKACRSSLPDLRRKRPGTAGRAGRVVSRPAGQDGLLHPHARPGHDQGRGHRSRRSRSWSSCAARSTGRSRTSTSRASPSPRPAGCDPARSAWSTSRPTSS